MLQDEDAAVKVTSLICNDALKQVWQKTKKVIVSDSWKNKYYFVLIWCKSKTFMMKETRHFQLLLCLFKLLIIYYL